MYVLGIHFAWEGARALVFDLEEASVVVEASSSYSCVNEAPRGCMLQNPTDWIQALDSIMRDIVGKLGKKANAIAAMSIGSQGGMVALDADNSILTPSPVHGDGSALRQSEELSRLFGGFPGLLELTGMPLDADSMAAHLMRFKQEQPQLFQKVVSFLSPHDFLNYWLTGVRRTDYGEASATGLLDLRNRRWSVDLCECIDSTLVERLPRVCQPLSILGYVRSELAEGWGLSPRLMVGAGSGEKMLGALGLGVVGKVNNRLALSLRDRAEFAAVLDKPEIDLRGELRTYCDGAGGWLPSIGLENALSVVRSVCAHYRESFSSLQDALGDAPMGAEGLTFLPYFQAQKGEHSGEFGGILHGITSENYTPQNVLQAAVEGVSLGLSYGFSRMSELNICAEEIRMSGEGAASPLWRQMIADVTGLPVRVAKIADSVALGAALQAAVSFFKGHSSEEKMSCEELVSYAVEMDKSLDTEPNSKAYSFYQEALSSQRYLIETLQPTGLL